MSFHPIEQAPGRLNRSELAIPGSQPQMFEKAAKLDVDVIFLDLEDAVAPDEKEQARKNIKKPSTRLIGARNPCRFESTDWIHIICIAMWSTSLNRPGNG